MSLGREAQIRWGAELKGPGLGAWSRRRNDNRQSLPAPQQHQILLLQQPWKEMVMAGKPWKLYIIFGSFQAFAQIISVVWTSKGKTKVLQTWTEPKHTWNKDKHCRCSYSLSPSLTPSCISDISMQWRFQSSLVHQSGRWQNAGQLRLVQIVSHCKGLRSKSWFIYSFLCSRSQILNSCQNAVPILWDMFCSWASQKNHLMPSRKSFTSWSILMTTVPTNTFKRLWSSFRSSTMLCITNQLVKEKTASQSKRENSYIQANNSIGDIDSIFPHRAWHPL